MDKKLIKDEYEIVKFLYDSHTNIHVYLVKNVNTNQLCSMEVIENFAQNHDLVVSERIKKAGMLADVNHDGIRKMLETFEEDNNKYIIYEYTEGVTLQQMFDNYGPFSVKQMVSIAIQIADILKYIHSLNPSVINRNIKPSNIMIGVDGKVKLVSFGIARVYKPEKTGDTEFLGTKGFASPEQYGLGQTDARTDIYGLGMTMHYLLTGKDPQAAGYQYKSITYYNANFPLALEQIIDKCTRFNIDLRYPDCGELLDDLKNLQL